MGWGGKELVDDKQRSVVLLFFSYLYVHNHLIFFILLIRCMTVSFAKSVLMCFSLAMHGLRKNGFEEWGGLNPLLKLFQSSKIK